MKRIASHSLLAASYMVILISSLAWWRSYSKADYLYRAEPFTLVADVPGKTAEAALNPASLTGRLLAPVGRTGQSVTLARGIASFKGALVIGKIEDTSNACPCVRYCHDIFPLIESSGPGMLQARPHFLATFLGFGITAGEITTELPGPLFFVKSLLNQKKYRAIYVPYYFFLLLGIVVPAMRLRRLIRSANLKNRLPAVQK